MAQDNSNRAAIGKDESALRQLLSMMLSDNPHVVDVFSELTMKICLTWSLLNMGVESSLSESLGGVLEHLVESYMFSISWPLGLLSGHF